MKIDQDKLRKLLSREVAAPSPDELRREENVFFVGGDLPERQTLETLFESHYQSHAALFHLTFGKESFQNGETLARMIKKNFNTHLMARFDRAPSPELIERAYAAGVDIIDIPSGVDSVKRDPLFLRALDCARAVFPRWSVVSTVAAAGGSPSAISSGIDSLLARDVLPLVTISGGAGDGREESLTGLFTHLQLAWREKKALIKPLLPLIFISTPFVPASSRGALRGFIDLIDDRRLLATSDLRRLLRVKEVEESFSSAGL